MRSARLSAKTTCRLLCRSASSSSRTPKGWTSAAPITEGRDRYAIVLGEKSPVTPEIYSELARLFLKSNTHADARVLRARPDFLLLHLRGQRHSHHRREAAGQARSRLGAHPSDGGRPRLLREDPRAALQPAPWRRGRSRPIATRSANRPRRWKPLPRNISPPGISRPPRCPAAPWRKAIFRSGQVSATEIALARADLLAGAQSAAEYQKLLAAHEKIPEAEEGLGTAGAAREAHRRRAQLFRSRRGSEQHQRALLHRIRQAGAATATRPRMRC